MSGRVHAIYAMDAGLPERIFSPEARERLARVVELGPVPLNAATLADGSLTDAELARTELIVGGWGFPVLDAALLDRMPRLRAVVNTAGSVKEFWSDDLLGRDIAITSAADVNALPVAEYTLGAILWSGKRAIEIARAYRETRAYRPFADEPERWGNNGLRVGIVGASRIGRRVIELLAPFDVEIRLYDPTLEAPLPGTRLVGLDDLLRESDVVSLHAPAVPQTRGMIDARALSLMPDGATLINTARGSLVVTEALIAELNAGRLHAVIDVTDPDPLPVDSPLFDAPNLVLTPHIAGSQGNELRRLGDTALAEVERFVANEPLLTEIAPEQLAITA